MRRGRPRQQGALAARAADALDTRRASAQHGSREDRRDPAVPRGVPAARAPGQREQLHRPARRAPRRGAERRRPRRLGRDLALAVRGLDHDRDDAGAGHPGPGPDGVPAALGRDARAPGVRAPGPRPHGAVGRRHGALGPARARPGPADLPAARRPDPDARAGLRERAVPPAGPRPLPRVPPRGRALHRPRLPRHEDEGRASTPPRTGAPPAPSGRSWAPTSSCSPTRTRATRCGPRSRPGASSRRRASPGSRSRSRRTTSRGTRTWRELSGSPSSAGRRSGASARSGPSSSATPSTPRSPTSRSPGGFTEVARVAALAAAWEVPIVPHVWGTAVNLYASLQLCAVLPGYRSHTSMPYPWFEYDQSPNPLRELWGAPGGRAGRHGRDPPGSGAGDRGRPAGVRAVSPAPRRGQPRLRG